MFFFTAEIAENAEKNIPFLLPQNENKQPSAETPKLRRQWGLKTFRIILVQDQKFSKSPTSISVALR